MKLNLSLKYTYLYLVVSEKGKEKNNSHPTTIHSTEQPQKAAACLTASSYQLLAALGSSMAELAANSYQAEIRDTSSRNFNPG